MSLTVCIVSLVLFWIASCAFLVTIICMNSSRLSRMTDYSQHGIAFYPDIDGWCVECGTSTPMDYLKKHLFLCHSCYVEYSHDKRHVNWPEGFSQDRYGDVPEPHDHDGEDIF